MAKFRKHGKRWQAIIRKSGQKPVVKTFFNKARAFLGHFGLQGIESALEVCQVVAQPDAVNHSGRDESTLLA